MSETISDHEARELRLLAMLHEGRAKSWDRLVDLADNAEVSKVCADKANAHRHHQLRLLAKLEERVTR